MHGKYHKMQVSFCETRRKFTYKQANSNSKNEVERNNEPVCPMEIVLSHFDSLSV
jgi:hypothetical protein